MRLKSKVLLILTILLSLLTINHCQQTEEDRRCNNCGYGGTAVSQGQLIIKYNNQWRSVCSTNFNDVDGDLACRSAYGLESHLVSWNGNAQCINNRFWLDNVQCEGTEDNLLNCNHNGFGTHSCSDSQCVELICSRETDVEVQTRLVLGILQVQYNNEWRYVCDDSFGQEDANVACRSIEGPNFVANELFTGQNCQGLDTVDFWLDDLICTGEENNLAQCSGYEGWGYHDCGASECIRLACQEQLAPEVSHLVHDSNGIVSITFRDETRAVCDDGWGETDSAVACAELYGNSAFFGYEQGHACNYNNFWLDDVACSGVELKIEECNHLQWGAHNCNPSYECVLLYCVGGGLQPPSVIPEADGTLVQNQETGILSFNYRNQLQAVCDDGFSDVGASVACLELYGNGQVVFFEIGRTCDYDNFWLDDVMCQGGENSIRNCPHTAYGNHNCNPQYECIALFCQAGGPRYITDQPITPVPVVGQLVAHLTHSVEGILSIVYQGEGRALCDDGFSQLDAEIACLELYGTRDVISYNIGRSCNYQDFWLDDVNCNGSEYRIQECYHTEFGQHNCNWQTECVSLFCRGGGPQTATEILMHHQGQLQMMRNDEIRSVCHHQFNQFAAESACFSMYGSYEVLSFELGQPCREENFWVDNILCNSRAPTLSSCIHDPFGQAQCDPANSCILLYCRNYGPQPNGTVQIIGHAEHNQVTGILSYSYSDQSRAVCDDGFAESAAQVACFELYQDQRVRTFSQGHRCDYQDFWLDDVNCEFDDQTLGECNHLPYGNHNCNPEYECVELFCVGGGPQPQEEIVIITEQHEYRITQSVTGLISMNVDGVNGNICQNGFDTNAANVVCNEIYGVPAQTYEIGFRCQYDNFWLNELSCNGNEQNLHQCGHQNVEYIACDPTSECVQVFCQNSGPRSPGTTLVQGDTGILGINRNRETRNICDDGFNEFGAEIACQELYGSSYVTFTIGNQCEFQGFWLDNVICQGYEDRLVDCQHNQWGIHDCGPQECIYLVCGDNQGYQPDADEPVVVLVHNQTSGVLSISRNGVVEGVCDDGFTIQSAQVACRELYNNPQVIQYTTAVRCDNADFWLDDVQCQGTEENLKDCQHLNWGVHNCNWQTECIALYCTGGGPVIVPEVVDVIVPQARLQHGIDGILSITYQDQTKAVCDDGWSIEDSNVACRELYGQGVHASNFTIAHQCDYQEFWLDQVLCNGRENTIQECSHNEWGNHDCSWTSECIQLFCQGHGPVGAEAFLIHSQDGVLNILYNGEVRSVGGSSFNELSAQTACLELYGTNSVVDFHTSVTCNYDQFWVDNVQCSYGQQRIQTCQHDPWGETSSTDGNLTNCVAVFCQGYGPQPEGHAETDQGILVHNTNLGLLNYYYNDELRSVCDHGFTNETAQVACNELYGNPQVRSFQVGQECEHNDFWLDDVSCVGSESQLYECSHLPFGVNNCDSSSNCVNLFCEYGGPQGQVINQVVIVVVPDQDVSEQSHLRVTSDGILQVYFREEIRAVCDDYFNEVPASVACRELYGENSVVVQLNSAISCVDNNFWLDNVQCQGTEAHLQDCQHNDWGVHDCGSTECIQLFCTEGGPEPNTAPLVHGNSGILNILYNGQIRAICDDGFNLFAAETACNELYGNPEIVTFRIGQQCDYQEFWLDDVDCTERGDKLTRCQHSPFGVHNCDPNTECILLQCVAQDIVVPAPVPPQEVSIYLIHNQENGVLSLSRDGDVRSICSTDWDETNSEVACLQLYGNRAVDKFVIGYECDYVQFWLEGVECVGTESRLSDCSHGEWGVHNCNPQFECVQLFCLNGGPQPERGHVWQNPVSAVISLTYERTTRSLCDDGFTLQAAEVICNELYGNPSVQQYFTNQQCDFEDFWLDNVGCEGTETLLDRCEHNPYGVHDCNYHYECVRVYCSAGGPQVPRGSLVHTQTGILAIQYNNEIRSLADSGFGDNEARTACTELYQNPNFMSYRTGETCIVENFWLDNVQCSLGQTTIDSCDHTNYGEVSPRTTSSSCIELFCDAGGPSQPTGHLVHSETGILNIRYSGYVKSVCHDRFTSEDAQVACRELYGSSVVIQIQVGQQCEYSEFWLDDINCNGQEQNIQDCPHARWGSNDCDPQNQCVKLYCQGGGPQPQQISPPAIGHSAEGILSITYNGETRALCDDLFDEISASVACFELYGSYQYSSYTRGHECDYSNYWANDVQCLGQETAIWECRQTHIADHNCDTTTQCVQLFCTGNGPQQVFVQFVHDPITAIISVDKNGELKAICDDGFTQESAQVFCHSMYNDPTVISFSQGNNCGGSLTDFWLDDVQCVGNEPSLQQCNHLDWGVHNCNPSYECVQIYCAGGGAQPPASLRQSILGIISITYLGTTKAVCDTNFNDQSAQVACNELVGSPEVISYSHGHACVYEEFWLSNVACQGGEPKLQDCHHGLWGEHQCDSLNNCVKLFCYGGGAQPVTGRLVHSESTGILSFTYESVTKAICDDGFGLNEAQIACLELYANFQVISFEQGHNCDYDDFWLDNVQCSGNERLLGECVHLPYGEHDCNPRTECIRLICSSGGYRPVDQQPIITHGGDGSLNVVYNGETKSVCDNQFNDFSANVACRELYGDPVFFRWSGEHICTHSSFWLDNVRCLGNESHLMDCNHSPIGQSQCNTNQCIRLYCRAGGPRVDESPLVHSSNGILSIMHEGSIKAVCDDIFNEVSASVACSELYRNPNVLSYTIGQSCDYNEFWIDNIQCNGGETRISDCNHNNWGQHDCSYLSECIRLSCEGGGYQSQDANDGHLVHNSVTGILSITYRQETRAVCDDFFGDEEAQIACLELYGNPSYLLFQHGFACDYNSFWTDDLICSGSEEIISQCQHTAWGTHNCNYNSECVKLICTEGGPELEGNGTLVLSSNNILSITFNGQTKGVCEDGFNEQNAQIACLELTGDATVHEFSGGHRCEYNDFWLDDVVCRGSETQLQECFHRRWGKHNCDPQTQCIQLACGETALPVMQFRHNLDTGIISLSVDDVEQGICDDGFTLIDAQVFCNQLYESPTVLSFEQGHSCGLEDFWLDDVSCAGSEANILDCNHNPLGVHNCNPNTECVQLYCEAGGPQPLARLVHNSDGILSIIYTGEIRSLCSNGFTENSAYVACLELYGDPEVNSFTLGHECSYQDFWVDRVSCVGTETRTQLCPHQNFGQANCNPQTDCVRLYCAAGGPQEQEIYVVQNQETGILSVEIEGVAKGFCQHQFDDAAAEVVCRQLYGRRASVISYSHGHACEYEDFWLDDVECQGEENTVAECDHSPIGVHSCDFQNECVQLYCSQGPQPPLIPPPILMQNAVGSLSMTYNNENRDVCQQGFDQNAALVACKELFNSTFVLSYVLDQPCLYNDFWLDGIQCQGTEESLIDCDHKQLGSNNCGPNMCVRLFCYGGGAEMIRVSENSTLIHGADGILSIEYRGEIRSICDDGFSQYAAQVVCNQLYGDSHVVSYTQQEHCQYDGFWLDDVVCNGDELALQQCSHSLWGTHNCNHENSCIKLYCEAGGPQQYLTPVTPEFQPGCVVLYSSCGYSGESRQICGDLQAALSEDEVGWQVMCIRIPEDYQVRIFDNSDSDNGEVDITESIPCLQQVQAVEIENILEYNMIQSKRKMNKPLSFALKSKQIKHTKKNLLRKNRKL